MSPTIAMEKNTILTDTARKALLNLKDAKDIAMDIVPTTIRPEVVGCIDGLMIDIQCGKTSDTQRKYYANVSPNIIVNELLKDYNFPYNRPSKEEFER